jgi:hypothetical protein
MTLIHSVLRIALALGLCQAVAAGAEAMRVGDRYELRIHHTEKYSDQMGGSGSSGGGHAITVRLVAQRDGGQELELDLPDGATEKDRLAEWKLPARIFVAADGKATLLNPAELEIRRDRFLKAANWTAEICERWIFTWNAFKIECDPQSVLEILKDYQIQPGMLAEGVPFALPGAVGSAPMRCTARTAGGHDCTATLPIDAESVRRNLAETDVVVGEITGKPVALADAAKARAATEITGTIETTFEVDVDGQATKRTEITRSKQRDPDGRLTTSTKTMVLTRRRL